MFTQDTLATVGAQSSNPPTVYSYRSDDDLATVTGAGYFADKQFQFEQGDWILCLLSSGNALLVVTSDTSTAAAISVGGGGGITYGALSNADILLIPSPSDFETAFSTDTNTVFTYYSGSWYSTAGGILV